MFSSSTESLITSSDSYKHIQYATDNEYNQ